MSDSTFAARSPPGRPDSGAGPMPVNELAHRDRAGTELGRFRRPPGGAGETGTLAYLRTSGRLHLGRIKTLQETKSTRSRSGLASTAQAQPRQSNPKQYESARVQELSL